MKKNLLIKILAAFFIVVGIAGCSKGPSKIEVSNLVKEQKKAKNNLIFNISVVSNEIGRKIDDNQYYKFVININGIEPDPSWTNKRCEDGPCREDIEYLELQEYLIGKNVWNEWEIIRSREKNRQVVNAHYRPAEVSLEEYYKDRISNTPSQAATVVPLK